MKTTVGSRNGRTMKGVGRSTVIVVAALFGGATAALRSDGEEVAGNLRRKRIAMMPIVPHREVREDEFMLKDQKQLENLWNQALLFGEEEKVTNVRVLQSMSLTARPTTPGPTNAPTPRPTTPTPPPTPAPTDSCLGTGTREAFLLTQLSAVTPATQLQDVTTPQGQAFNWLVNQDPLSIDPCTFPTTAQRYGLATFFFATGGEQWTTSTNWLQNTNECLWFGITCEANQNTTVTRITLPQNQLSGSLPNEISTLPDALRIDFFSNNIQGTIPPGISSLSLLELLDVEENNLAGSLFTNEVLQLTNLAALRGSFNDFTGTIPTQIGNLNNLEQLWFADNAGISGSLPTEIGLLTSLQSIFGYLNGLTGNIPSQMGGTNQVNLTQIRLYSNTLIGTIPTELVAPTGLATIRLDSNQLTGSVPTQIGQLAFLQDFRINDNTIFGFIPSEIGNLLSLENLILNNNFFSGAIPTQAFSSLSSVRFVDISNNNFLGGSIPSTLFDSPSIRNVYLSNCSLTGTLPSNYATPSSLRDLFIDGNNLVGTIPSVQAGQLLQLNEFLIHNNAFTGSVPASVCQLRTTANQGGNLEDLWSDCLGNPPEILCDFPDCCNRCFA